MKLLNIWKRGKFLLYGDFNARTGGLLVTDYVSLDEIGQTFSDCPIPNYYTPDLNLPSNYLDKQSNIHGYLLTKICKSSHLSMLNGRFLGDSLGFYTFFNPNGKSTVDYMLASNTLYHKIVYFNVDTPSELSDHCIIFTGLNLEKSGLKHQKDLDENCNHIGGNILWSEDCKDKYVQALVEPKSATSIISLYTDLDDENNSDIDSLVEKQITIYTEAGFRTVKFRENYNKTCKRTRDIKRKKNGCRTTA